MLIGEVDRSRQTPGSGELVAVGEVVARVDEGSELQYQMMKRWVLQHLRLRQGRMTARPLLPASERAVQMQHHVAEHVAQQQQPQEVVAEELDHARFCDNRERKWLC